jgi:hypothetical protein
VHGNGLAALGRDRRHHALGRRFAGLSLTATAAPSAASRTAIMFQSNRGWAGVDIPAAAVRSAKAASDALRGRRDRLAAKMQVDHKMVNRAPGIPVSLRRRALTA